MNKFTAKFALGLAATAGLATMGAFVTATGASADSTTTTTSPAPTTTTTLAPPAQGVGPHHLFLYVDTVTGGASNPKPAGDCVQTNTFLRGQQVVFRMYGINIADHGANLTSANVASAFVRIPGLAKIPLKFGNHGTTSYWTAAWTVGQHYPLGVVDFSVHVVTKAVPATSSSAAVGPQGGVFTQKGLAMPSRLAVVAK
jgi:hypothetical protein